MLTSQETFNVAFSAALASGRIRPHFQPVVRTQDGRIDGFEVLSRWHEPGHGDISPGLFIHLAERGGLLDALMEAVMRQALAAAREWPAHLILAFNVSPAQLRSPDLPERIAALAEEGGFPPERIGIEITETAIIENTTGAGSMLDRLRALGCSLAMDDFGTGFSSLTWLQTLPFSTIKIDASFVRSMLEQRQSRKIVTAVAGLGRSLGLNVVAEGVETEEQAELLHRVGATHLQGYLLGRPVPAETVPTLLAKPTTVHGGALAVLSSLEQRAAQISALYQVTETAICFVDTRFVIVDASETFARRFGRPRNAMLGQNMYDLAPQEAKRRKWLQGFREQGLPYPPFEFVRPDGGIDLVTLSQVKDEAGELLGYCILGVDITEWKAAEAALRESEEHYRLTAQLSMRIFWQLDPQGGLIAFDDNYSEKLAASLSELKDKGWEDLVHPDDLDQVRRAWTHALAAGEIYDNEMRYRMADGNYRWVRAFAAPQRAEDGTILRWFGQTEDIDARKRTEIALRESEERYRVAAMLSPRISWEIDATGALIRIDERFAEITGVVLEDVAGCAWLALVHPEDRATVSKAFANAMAQRSVYDEEMRFRVGDGTYRWFRSYLAPQLAEDGSVVHWFGQKEDIDDRKQAEIALRKKKAQFHFIVENCPNYFWTATPDGAVQRLNPVLREMVGLTAEAAKGDGWLVVVHPEDREAVVRNWERCRMAEIPVDLDCRIRLVDGTHRWFRVWGAPFSDDTGAIQLWYGTLTMLTPPRPMTTGSRTLTRSGQQIGLSLSMPMTADEDDIQDALGNLIRNVNI